MKPSKHGRVLQLCNMKSDKATHHKQQPIISPYGPVKPNPEGNTEDYAIIFVQ